MNFPVYVRAGPFLLHPHWVFDALAYIAGIGLFVVWRRSHADVLDSKTRWIIVAAAIAGGAIGSHLLFLVEDLAILRPGALEPAMFLQGKTIVGGLLGGVMAVEWVKKRLGITVATGDLLVLPLCLGIAIGRIGCFLTGLSDGTAGTPTALPWGIDFGDGIPRHPTQLYEILFIIVLAALLWRLRPRLRARGDMFRLFLLGYLTFRVLVDFIKPATRIAGVSVLQWACLAAIAYYAPQVPRLVAEVRGD